MRNYTIGFFTSLFIHSLIYGLFFVSSSSFSKENTVSVDISSITIAAISGEGTLESEALENQANTPLAYPPEGKEVQAEEQVEKIEEPLDQEIVKTLVLPEPKAVEKKKSKKKKPPQEKKQKKIPPSETKKTTSDQDQSVHKGDEGQKLEKNKGKGQEWEHSVAKKYATSNYGYITRRIQKAMQYPSQARRMGWQGVAKIMFTINPDGRVSNIKQLHSSGYQILDEAGVQAIKDASPFSPAPEVKTSIVIPLSFKLI